MGEKFLVKMEQEWTFNDLSVPSSNAACGRHGLPIPSSIDAKWFSERLSETTRILKAHVTAIGLLLSLTGTFLRPSNLQLKDAESTYNSKRMQKDKMHLSHPAHLWTCIAATASSPKHKKPTVFPIT